MPATVVCHGVPTGLTLTASIFPDGSDTAAASAIATTEATNRKTTYTFSANVSGLHLIQLLSGSNVVWVGWALLATSGTIEAEDSRRVALNLDGKISEVSGGGGSGSGAYTLTVTVNDGATALQNATVRMTEGVNTFTALTNASGVAVFALDAATYAVAITKNGYQFTPTTRVVSATASQTYSMTAVTITPSPADQVTGYLTTYDENGDVEADVDVTLRIKSAPSDAGFALDSADRVATSDVNGLVEFPGMFPGARYSIWRGTEIPQNPKSFLLPTDATDPTALDSFVGTP